jgi:tryptophan synthase alpha chain
MALPLATTSSEPRLAATWAELRQRGRIALIPYLTAGHPDPARSLDALRMADEVADILEVGVPFSDPLADGPTIQRSIHQALDGGMTLARTFELVDRAAPRCPVIIFSYLNPILRYGLQRFLSDASAVGVAGLLLTDLPAGEDPALEAQVRESPLDLIRLVAPTTAPARLRITVKGAQGFIYLIARLGVTGASGAIDAGLAASIARVRGATSLPIAVGFGISSPAQAAAVAGLADGVVVGSALVERLGSAGVAGAADFLGAFRSALDQGVAP